MCRHCLPVPYQDQVASGPARRKEVGLSSFHVQSLSARPGSGAVGINSGHKDVLTCRQVAVVISAFGKASHVLAVDGHDKAEIAPKIRDPVND
jgi:hypothetical protein